MLNQRGQALVESLGTLAFASAALVGGLALAYTGFAHLWLKHAAYETSICLSTPEIASNCENELRRSTATALPFGRLERVSLARSRADVRTEFRWRLGETIDLGIEDRRTLPLLGRSLP